MRFLFRQGVLCAALALTAFAADPTTARRAPGFSLNDTKGQQHDLYDYRGKVVLIDFMQTGCPHCRELTPVLEKAKQKYAGRVAVLSVVVPPDNLGTVNKYIGELNVTSPMLFDCGQVAASYVRATPQNPRVSFPRLFIVDAGGTIRQDISHSKLSESLFTEQGLFPLIDQALGTKK